MFFYQVIGDPANIFIIIVAVAVGFVSALGYVDSKRQAKKQEDNKDMPR